jgi:hypothetical protein
VYHPCLNRERARIDAEPPIACAAPSAMCAIFGLQGYLQELILQHTFQNRYSLFVTALQCGTLATLAVVQLAVVAPDTAKDKCVHRRPHRVPASLRACTPGPPPRTLNGRVRVR